MSYLNRKVFAVNPLQKTKNAQFRVVVGSPESGFLQNVNELFRNVRFLKEIPPYILNYFKEIVQTKYATTLDLFKG